MEEFRQIVNDSELIDMGYEEVKYTWWNNRGMEIAPVRD